MRDDSKVVIGTIAITVAVLWSAIWYDEQTCLVKGRSFSDVEYNFIGGCMVKHNDKWLPIENIRGFDDK